MELRLLTYFLAVAQEGTITRAAERLHITQSSLSRQIMELETEVGKCLFIRGKRRITLTDEGILLRKRAEEILQLCAKTKRELAQNDVLQGEISIGGGQSDAVLQAASQLAALYPGVRFRLCCGDEVEITEHLDQGTLDFGVLLEPVNASRYDSLSLPDQDSWGFFMSPHHELTQKEWITPQDIARQPLIIPQRPGLQQELAAWAGIPINQLHIMATFNLLYSNPAGLVRNGLGCAYGLSKLLAPSPEFCFRPLYPPQQVHYALVWKRYQVFSSAARTFLATLTQLVQPQPAQQDRHPQ